MFDAFYDVKEKADAGNAYAKKVVQSWADAEWFTSRDEVAEKITVTVYMVPGETNTDDLSPAPDAWSRPDIPCAYEYCQLLKATFVFRHLRAISNDYIRCRCMSCGPRRRMHG